MAKYKIAWMPGDGVGKDVMDAGKIVLDALPRARPGGIGVRVVGRPHEIVHPHELTREYPDAVHDERR